MKRSILALLAFVAAVSAFPAPAITVGQPAPDFALPDVQGKTLKLSDYAGKFVVLEWVNPEDIKTARNHVRAALDEALSGRPVSVAASIAYGCSIKYAN